MLRLGISFILACLALIAGAIPAWAESYEIDPYVQLRLGKSIFTNSDKNPVASVESPSDETLLGFSAGANIGRYFGLELAVDNVETGLNSSLTPSNGGKLGEVSLWTVLAQGRLRYPMLDDRLEPYLVLGLGAGLGEFNDRNVVNRNIQAGGGLETSFVGSAGLGVEYFLANNIALGLEGRYLYSFDYDMMIAGSNQNVDLDNVMITAGLRVFLDRPATRDPSGAEAAAKDSDALRGYLALRAGANIFTDTGSVPGAQIDSSVAPVGAAALGLNINKYLGLEFAGEYSEVQLVTPGVGKSAEYSLWTTLLLARLRYPMFEDRFSPYIVAGGGVGWGEINDRDVPFYISGVNGGRDTSPVGAAGVGFDYFLAENLALNFEAKHTFLFGTNINVNGVSQTLSLDSVSLTGGLRIFFP